MRSPSSLKNVMSVVTDTNIIVSVVTDPNIIMSVYIQFYCLCVEEFALM